LTFEESPSAVQEGDVGTRFFNVNLGNFDLGGVRLRDFTSKISAK